jgi:hypothetical protein
MWCGEAMKFWSMLKCFERESFVENKIPNLRYSSNQSELDSNGWKAIKKGSSIQQAALYIFWILRTQSK